MRILIPTSAFPTDAQPYSASYVLDLARCLAIEHDVLILHAVQIGPNEITQIREERLEPRISLLQYAYHHPPRTWIGGYLWSLRRVLPQLRAFHADVLFTQIAWPAGAAAALLSRLLRIPSILLEHWGPAKNWLESGSVPAPLQRWALRQIYGRSDYLAAVSRGLAAEIESVFGTPVHGVIPNPIDTAVFRPAEHCHQGHDVICVTRVNGDPRKGLEILLAAWSHVAKVMPEATLTLVGYGSNSLADQCKRLALQRVVLRPWLPPIELSAAVRQSSVAVVPSRYETFSRTAAEALACGVPVVSTRCGGPDEFIGACQGILVPVDDAVALAEAIVAALHSNSFDTPQQLADYAEKQFGFDAVLSIIEAACATIGVRAARNLPSVRMAATA